MWANKIGSGLPNKPHLMKNQSTSDQRHGGTEDDKVPLFRLKCKQDSQYTQNKSGKKKTVRKQGKEIYTLQRYFQQKNRVKQNEQAHEIKSNSCNTQNFVNKYAAYFQEGASSIFRGSQQYSRSIQPDHTQKSIFSVQSRYNLSNSLRNVSKPAVNKRKQKKQEQKCVQTKLDNYFSKNTKLPNKQIQKKLQNYFYKNTKKPNATIEVQIKQSLLANQQSDQNENEQYEDRETQLINEQHEGKSIVRVYWNQLQEEIMQQANDQQLESYQQDDERVIIHQDLENLRGQIVNIIADKQDKNSQKISSLQFKLPNKNSYLAVAYSDMEEFWSSTLKSIFESYM